MTKKAFIASVLFIALFGIGVFSLAMLKKGTPEPSTPAETENNGPRRAVIGASVEGRNIESYTYGNGEKHLLFVGGMHGGYEWNSVLLAYQFMEYLEKNLGIVPAAVKVTVIPSANPDGLYTVIGKEGRFTALDIPADQKILASGRFNANGVDLNRNFDCKWKPKSMWREKTVSAGSSPFSEPEARAIQNFIVKDRPGAVVFWHSQANAVYASSCEDGILPATLDIMNAYARASRYQALKSFDSYEITGSAEGWLASLGIPAITVELQTHETVEWERNLAGIKALFQYAAGTGL